MSAMRSAVWLTALLSVAALATMDVGVGAQAYLGLGAVAAILLLHLLRPTGWLLYAVLAFCTLISLRYLVWRFTHTLPSFDSAAILPATLLLAAELHGFALSLLGLFANARARERALPPVPAADAAPSVDVFVPTYDEPVEVVRLTLIAATQLRYPADRVRVHLLDDGGTDARLWADPSRAARAEALRALCAETGARYRTRRDNAGAKAGNVNAALAATTGDLILILDCDHVPAPDILEATVGYFAAEPDLAFVQTPHFFRNPDPIERNLDVYADTPTESELFYSKTLKGLDHWNAAFFCGSAAILRRRALEAVGGVSSRSITEDAETALQLHAAGYTSAYLDRPMVAGLAPETLAAFVQQRTRWCQGMIQILLLDNPFTKAGLTTAQRLGYLSAIVYWLFPLSRLAFLLAPLAFIFLDLQIVYATPAEFAAYIVPHVAIALFLSNYLYGRLRVPFMSDAYEAAQSLFLAPAVLSVLRNPTRPEWKVTPKNEALTHDFMSQLAGPLALLLLTLAAAQGWAVARLLAEPHNALHLGIVLIWNGINLVIALAAFAAAFERGTLSGRLVMPVNLRARLGSGMGGGAVVITATNGVEAEIAAPPGSDAGALGVLAPDDLVTLDVDHGHAGAPSIIRARVLSAAPAGRKGGARRIAFACATLEEERALAAALYGSSARWTAFQEGRRGRRSVPGGLLRLAAIGIAQLGRMLAAASSPARSGRRPARTAVPAAAPAPRRGPGTALVIARAAIVLVALFGAAAAMARDGAQDAAQAGLSAIAPDPAEIDAGAAAAPAAAALPAAAAERDIVPAVAVVSMRAMTRDGALGAIDRDSPRARFEFVVAAGAPPVEAALQLGWVSSAALGAMAEGLELRLNGARVATLPLAGDGLLQTDRFALPLDGLRPGANTLDLVALYADALRCGGSSTPSWTSIAPGQSFLALTGGAAPANPTLADLDRSGWRWEVADQGVTLLTPPAPDARMLTVGANLAGALALRRSQPGLAVAHAVAAPQRGAPAADRAAGRATDPARDPLPGLEPESLAPGLNLLFGDVETLRPYLHPALADQVDRAVIGVHRPPAAPRSVVVVLTARSAADVHLAASTLANPRLALPAAAWAEVPRTLSAEAAFGGALAGQSRYRFDARDRLAFDVEDQRLSFDMPPGFVANDNRKLALELDYAHAPGLPPGALMEIVVNGEIVRAVPLDAPDGALVRGRPVALELARLRPGPNEIRFRARIGAAAEDACAEAAVGDWFEVFADSALTLPRLLEIDRRPDLRAQLGPQPGLARDGGRDTTLVLGSEGSVGAAWTFAARLAVGAGQPLTRLEVRLDETGARRDLVWIGPLDRLDGRTLSHAGLAGVMLANAGQARIDGLGLPEGDLRRALWQEGLEAREGGAGTLASLTAALGLDALSAAVGDAAPALAGRLGIDGELADTVSAWRGTVTAFLRLEDDSLPDALPRDRSFEAALAGLPRRGAAGEAGVAIYLVAPDEQALDRATLQLVQPDRWDRLEGSAVAWRGDERALAAARPAMATETLAGPATARDLWLAWANWFATRRGVWLGAVAAACLLLGVGAAAAVGRGDDR